MIKLYHYYLFSCLFCLLSLQMQSQNNPTIRNRFIVNVDYNSFWKNDSSMYVEISTAVYPGLSILKQDSLGFHGKVELLISILNKSNGTYVQNDRFSVPINIIDSASLAKTGSVVNKATYILGSGSYFVSISAYDIYNKMRRDSSSFTIDIMKKPVAIALSDIELSSNISESSDQADKFYKNTYRVIPNPNCLFGSTSYPVVFTYTELYNLNTEITYAIKAQIVDSKGEIKKYRTHLRHFSIPNVVDVTTLNVTSIGSGKYNYEIILSDTLGHEYARSQKPIYIYNPNIISTEAEIISQRSAEFANMSSNELEEEFRTAKYIAKSEDINRFEKLSTIEARRNFLAEFWTKIENSEQGYTALTRTNYLQRVQLANQRYKTYAKDGWRTDRGRVYVLFGEPDETQRIPYSVDSKPYEIWSYHRLEGGVVFVFIDLTEYNEYVLVHSTKRGEIRNDSWERLLQ
jgi:GWxTD domain-containing protein